MSDLDHWDFATQFSGFEIAMLLVGEDPRTGDSIKAEHALKKVRNSYLDAFLACSGVPVHAEPALDRALFSIFLLHDVKSKKYTEEELFDRDILKDFDRQRFTREAVERWIRVNSIASKYEFGARNETSMDRLLRVERAVKNAGGNKSAAARALGVSPQSVSQDTKKLNQIRSGSNEQKSSLKSGASGLKHLRQAAWPPSPRRGVD